jgi:redox-sensitive bicupin YhaK (pirin superfamily)
MTDPVLRTMPLGMQWPTLDPFLFCAHHDDAYPAGNAHLGPDASLAGREIGMDFAEIDGWNMYHGQRVPGFPPHPHRGFETVTYVRKGLIDHSDSLGAAARFGRGDVQWLTAGRGIQHSEMFPLLDEDEPNPLELFQIWLNLPAADKMVDPYFTMFWDQDLPRVVVGAPDAQAEITVIAGRVGDAQPPQPPPDSWAGRTESDVAIWHLVLNAGASWVMPVADSKLANRTIYVFEGSEVEISGHDAVLSVNTGAVVRCDVPVEISSGEGAEILVLQGSPIGEPVAQHGPFVMNTQRQISEAFTDYQQTQFGGWPWAAQDPVHARDQGRFARHVDDRVEHPSQVLD